MYSLSSLLWIVFAFLVLWISFRYLIAPENPWKNAGIPVVSRWDSLRSYVNFKLFPMNIGLERNYKKYGKLFGLSSYGSSILCVGDPELIRLVMVKDFQYFINRIESLTGDPAIDNMMSTATGEKWKRIRSATSPTFSTGKIRKMTSIILDCAESLTKNFDKEASLKTPSDIKRFITAFTMDAIAITAFGTKIDSLNDLNSPFVKAATEIFSRSGQFRSFLLVIFNSVLNYLHLKALNMRLFTFFEKMTKNIIEERKKSGLTRNDFLQLMLDASALNSSTTKDTVEKTNTTTDSEEKSEIDERTALKDDDDAISKGQKGLSDDEIMSQCIIFLLGGFETVSSTVTFALYELALNENVQEELISEIDEVLRLNQKEFTYENVQNMKYMDNVAFETLRKYPPAPFTQRLTQMDYEVVGRNFVIPKNTAVVIPIYALHHDEEYFPNPDVFDPNRFTAEEKARRDPYVYLPFGAGPRNCVAMRFALFEVKLCLAYLLSRYRFRRCSKTQVPLKFPFAQPQLVAKDIFLIVEKRKDGVF